MMNDGSIWRLVDENKKSIKLCICWYIASDLLFADAPSGANNPEDDVDKASNYTWAGKRSRIG